MKAHSPSLRLTVFIADTDQWNHQPLFHEIVRRARKAGLTGASAFRGIEGFGAAGRIHTSRILSLADNLPLVIIIIDTEDRIRGFLPLLDGVIGDGLIAIDPVETIRCSGRDTHA